MKRWLMGIAMGVVVGWAVQGAAQTEPVLQQVDVPAARGIVLNIPQDYGTLVSVTESSEVQHLFFEDAHGNIRVMLLGPQGAVQRAKHGLQLLSSDVYLIKRHGAGSPAAHGG